MLERGMNMMPKQEMLGGSFAPVSYKKKIPELYGLPQRISARLVSSETFRQNLAAEIAEMDADCISKEMKTEV